MDNEANMFEHVLYEMEMYFYSYIFIPNGSFETNMAIDCRAIHLRNLACFFYRERYKDNWHVTNFVADTSGIRLIDDEILFKDIRDFTSRATGHLLRRYWLSHTYKVDTMRCYEKAFPLVMNAAVDFLDMMGDVVKEERRADWENERIQGLVANTRNMMKAIEFRNSVHVIGETGASY